MRPSENALACGVERDIRGLGAWLSELEERVACLEDTVNYTNRDDENEAPIEASDSTAEAFLIEASVRLAMACRKMSRATSAVSSIYKRL